MRMSGSVLLIVPPLVHVESEQDPHDTRPNFEIQRLVSPVEPMSVAADLLERGMRVQVLDLGAFPTDWHERLTHLLSHYSPDAVVIVQSVLTFATASDWDGESVFDQVRNQYPHVITVLTGAAPTNSPGASVSKGICDFEIRGEPDRAVGELLTNIANHGDPGAVSGTSYRQEDGSVFTHTQYPRIDVTTLPLPAYSVLDAEHHERYAQILEKGKIRFPEKSPHYRDIMLSRSCVLRCSFCAVAHLRGPSQKYRRKTLDQTRAEIEQALEQGIQEIHFFDDLFAAEEKEILTFIEMLARWNLKFPWFVAQGMPLWPLSRDALKGMAETGFYRLIAPFESGNQRVLKNVTKKVRSKIDHHHNVAVWAHELGIEIIGMFVVGMPGETRSEILETLQFAQEHPEIDYSVFSIATPMVGTQLMRTVSDGGLLKDKDQINRVIKRTVALYRSDQFREYEMGIIRAFDWDRINFSTVERRKKYASMVGISLGELDQLRAHSKEVFHTFYPNYDGPRSFFDLYEKPDLFIETPVIPASTYRRTL